MPFPGLYPIFFSKPSMELRDEESDEGIRAKLIFRRKFGDKLTLISELDSGTYNPNRITSQLEDYKVQNSVIHIGIFFPGALALGSK
ncbi:hypothetical protein AYI69_g4906 [Smittium culicis]|uniref:Uncharacterized protein n=1 Tax=Smittium culicis TaxID=133412 RepID=A0A1R1XEP1_9FUNG|nr:hypothetical protein AYI69_g9140 [Smittium culicis]OMJ23610.1 hypothetical protein AYI69_g4906 [Smittium culicis]